jgi:hypothetical protein
MVGAGVVGMVVGEAVVGTAVLIGGVGEIGVLVPLHAARIGNINKRM